MTVTAPVAMDGRAIGAVTVIATTEPAQRRIARYAGLVLLVTMGALVIGVLAFSQAALAIRARELSRRQSAPARAKWRKAEDRGGPAPKPQDGGGGPALRRHRP